MNISLNPMQSEGSLKRRLHALVINTFVVNLRSSALTTEIGHTYALYKFS